MKEQNRSRHVAGNSGDVLSASGSISAHDMRCTIYIGSSTNFGVGLGGVVVVTIVDCSCGGRWPVDAMPGSAIAHDSLCGRCISVLNGIFLLALWPCKVTTS